MPINVIFKSTCKQHDIVLIVYKCHTIDDKCCNVTATNVLIVYKCHTIVDKCCNVTATNVLIVDKCPTIDYKCCNGTATNVLIVDKCPTIDYKCCNVTATNVLIVYKCHTIDYKFCNVTVTNVLIVDKCCNGPDSCNHGMTTQGRLYSNCVYTRGAVDPTGSGRPFLLSSWCYLYLPSFPIMFLIVPSLPSFLSCW